MSALERDLRLKHPIPTQPNEMVRVRVPLVTARDLRLKAFERYKPWRCCECCWSREWREIGDRKFVQQTKENFCECGLSRYWHEKLFNRISLLAALATSPRLGQKISIACLAPISWPAALATSPRIVEKFPIAFLAKITWLAPLATSPRLGQKLHIMHL